MRHRTLILGFSAVMTGIVITWALAQSGEQGWEMSLRGFIKRNAQEWVDRRPNSWRVRGGSTAEVLFRYTNASVPLKSCRPGDYGIKTLTLKGEYALRYLIAANNQSFSDEALTVSDIGFYKEVMKAIYYSMFKDAGGEFASDGTMNLEMGVDFEPIPFDSACQGN
ncbi:MAG: hypothetical protein HY547_00395 [Elusimicrobia bacterium]|nr:hypothetical protein [Elusimicrobiota bacterium]